MATGVKEADVWAAADALLHAGEQPTIEKVRLHLGRGSPNTVGPHLKNWFRGLGERLLAGQGGASDIPQAVTHAVSQVWEAALVTARGECTAETASEREELANAQAALEVDRASHEQERDRLRVRESDLEAATKSAQDQAAAAETRLQATERQMRESAHELKEAHSQLAESRDQVTALQQALQAAHTTNQESLMAAEARHTAHERRWLGEIDEHRQALKRAQEELVQLRKAAGATATQHRHELDQALTASSGQIQRAMKAETEIQALKAQLEAGAQAARAAETRWESASTQLTVQINTLRHQLQTKDRQMELLMQGKARRTRRSVHKGDRKVVPPLSKRGTSVKPTL
ncbi:DNA-binding protein [Castellaniella defragrans]|uniref:DNA-binding protein n=1 Tax=Castellaniella defragrans TaxID=75697 RepID=UPI0009FC7E82|nr:DNA-binding protein [Castellaniella defragrans]